MGAVVRVDTVTFLQVVQIDHPVPSRVIGERVRGGELESVGEPLVNFQMQTRVTEIGRRLEDRESADRTLRVRIIPLRDGRAYRKDAGRDRCRASRERNDS